MKRSLLILMVTFGGWASTVSGQDILGKQAAVDIAMKNNFDIRMAENQVEEARNNASIQNSRYLPVVSASAGGNYSNTGGKIIDRNDNENLVENNETSGLNANVGMRYTVFDGLGRSNTYKQLKENYSISELQARVMVENTVLNIFTSYYEIARLSQNVENQKQTLNVSNVRLKRAQYNFEYGQGTKLDILNAEVDYNNDSITYLTTVQQLANEKRNLNLLLGRDVNTVFDVDTTLQYDSSMVLPSLLTNAEFKSAILLQQEHTLYAAQYQSKSTRSGGIPKLDVNASYAWNQNNMGAAGFIQQSNMTGPQLGATLSWNIYDGGATRIARQNAQIRVETQNINYEKEKLNVERNIANAWTAYQTALFVKEAQEVNLKTAQTNFDRSVDQYKLGQIDNITFRQAQVNLLSAQLELSKAKYSAKNSELYLLQVSGNLEDAIF